MFPGEWHPCSRSCFKEVFSLKLSVSLLADCDQWEHEGTLSLGLVLCGSQLLELHAWKFSKSPSYAWDVLSHNWWSYLGGVLWSWIRTHHDPSPCFFLLRNLQTFYLVCGVIPNRGVIPLIPQGVSQLNFASMGLSRTQRSGSGSRGDFWEVYYRCSLPWYFFYGTLWDWATRMVSIFWFWWLSLMLETK